MPQTQRGWGAGQTRRPLQSGSRSNASGISSSSITSGRLSGHQLPKLISGYAHTWLVVEGRDPSQP